MLLDDAIAWLRDLGLDQWQGNGERQRTHVETDLAAETLFVVERDATVVATIRLDEFADTDFWHDEDDPAAALYVHRMAVAGSDRGVGLGSAMLDWAADRAEAAGHAAETRRLADQRRAAPLLQGPRLRDGAHRTGRAPGQRRALRPPAGYRHRSGPTPRRPRGRDPRRAPLQR